MVPKVFEPLKFYCAFERKTMLLRKENEQERVVFPENTVDSRYLAIRGTLKTVRDIRTSTYQIYSIEEKTI